RGVQRGERLLRGDPVRGVLPDLGADRLRRWPAARVHLLRRAGRGADAVRSVSAAALGAWRPHAAGGDPAGSAAHDRRSPAGLRPGRPDRADPTGTLTVLTGPTPLAP